MIPISEIGEGEDAVLCFTDLRECCRNRDTLGNMVLGNWFYPNGEEVKTKSHSNQGFYRNRDHSVVRLHWRENITAPTGQFCCKVLDATHQTVTVCINVNILSSSTLTHYGDDTTSTTPVKTEGQESE